ncbi:MAG TPA: DUF3592 domain-containing protein, partial [Spirochaetes bacterium]|nr:DUF3592 domain-containing protein [Spirochaetota bacterium]
KESEIREFLTSLLQSEALGMPLLLLVVGLFGFAVGTARSRYAIETPDWPRTGGRVISIHLKTRSTHDVRVPGEGLPSSRTIYEPVITYEYTVGSKAYRSNHRTFGNTGFDDKKKAIAVINRYRVDQELTVSYKPGNPSLAVIEKAENEGQSPRLVMGAVFSVLGAVMLLIGVVNRARRLFSD